MPEILTLYHSTDRQCLQSAQKIGTLFGHEVLKPRQGYSGEANLTPDKNASLNFIRIYRGEGRWREIDGPPDLVMLTFQLPQEILKLVGKTHLFGCLEYATTLTVDARDIPRSYFQNYHASSPRLTVTKEEEIERQDRGKVRFYQVPMKGYLKQIETVEYSYRGVKYPKK